MDALRTQQPDFIGACDIEQHKTFIEALAKYQEFANIKNMGAAIHAMIKGTEQLFDNLQFDDKQEWVQLTSIFGSSAIPKEAAEVITLAVKKLIESGDITAKSKWRAIELWAADCLGGE